MKLARMFGAALLSTSAAHAQNVIFHEDFEGGYANWSMTGLWNAQDTGEPCSGGQMPFPSGTHCVWFGYHNPVELTCDYSLGAPTEQFLTCTQLIALPATSGSIALRFHSISEGEDDGVWDQRSAQIREAGTTSWAFLPFVFSSPWVRESFDVTRWAGMPVEIRFRFNAGDPWQNFGIGWLIDDVQLVEFDSPGVVACSGDGTWYACPCVNTGGPGRGCASSFAPAGAAIAGSGVPSIGADTLRFDLDGMSHGAATLFEASAFNHTPQQPFAGDGISCVGGTFVRIATRFAPGGVLSYPGVGDAPVSVPGFVAPGTTRYYAARYRDAAAFCTSATFNITNAISIYWRL